MKGGLLVLNKKHIDLLFTDILRMFINFWLIGNFLYFYCYKTDGSSELEQFKGLDEIELDIVRKSVM